MKLRSIPRLHIAIPISPTCQNSFSVRLVNTLVFTSDLKRIFISLGGSRIQDFQYLLVRVNSRLADTPLIRTLAITDKIQIPVYRGLTKNDSWYYGLSLFLTHNDVLKVSAITRVKLTVCGKLIKREQISTASIESHVLRGLRDGLSCI